MTKQTLARWLAALGLGLALVGAPTLAKGAPASTTSPTAPAAEGPAARASGDDHDRQLHYAQREAASPRAADFKGNGVGVYIGGSTLAVVLVIVLIVVLL
ncbi:MAG TPA: hypothetical protein VG319_06135 [Polyangia bacterium]|jgi:hypothetical protein|nr:hypothetical protein [Polyangia bacterium]